MKKIVTILIALIISLSFIPTTLAGGAPKGNYKKGTIVELNKVERTIVFQPAGSDRNILLYLDKTINMNEIELNQQVIVTLGKGNEANVAKNITRMFISLKTKAFVFILFVGFVGGLVSGFIGSGGAFVLTPGMMSLGVPGAVAVASNMCHKFPKAMVGAYKRYKYGQVDLKLGLIMACSAIVGVQLGIRIQEYIFRTWGDAGSNLYVSLAFVIILVTVGGYVFRDAWKISKGRVSDNPPKLARLLQGINLPPMITLKRANVKISLWFTIPVGFCTGLMAATIAVGGFVGVPGMMYVVGAPALVASATELIIAFVMGFTGSIKWALNGLIDIRLTLLILAASLFGVQLGALGTTYVKDYMIKTVMGTIMLIVAVSRGLAIPKYLTDLGVLSLEKTTTDVLMNLSFLVMAIALFTGGIIILSSLWKGIREHKVAEEAVIHGKV
jgi:hypothetical protein